MTSPDPIDPVFDARLAELRSRFKSALGPKVEGIAAAIAQVGAGAMPLAASEDLLREVHSLAGAAAMFGLEEVNRAAAALERTILALRSREHADPEDIGALRDSCARLESVAQTCT
jgi:chemotaxis protein histidine kinase CheA